MKKKNIESIFSKFQKKMLKKDWYLTKAIPKALAAATKDTKLSIS